MFFPLNESFRLYFENLRFGDFRVHEMILLGSIPRRQYGVFCRIMTNYNISCIQEQYRSFANRYMVNHRLLLS